ncbi:WhiB family transcriptional regulator [Streptomyces sp. NPDC007117]|uniref:WhiB family transcriptional regulator n=1 Tax=Streptomyces sp. NPDC007117 TaxID=3154314 RepID=UPI0033D49499
MSTTIFKVVKSHAAPDTLGPAKSWKTTAACRDVVDDELWFPEATDKATAREAISVCLGCPVLLLCRQAAADEERGQGKASRYGIRGGLTPVQRWEAAASSRAGRKPAQCGTRAAYARHLRKNEPVDDACRQVNAEYVEQLRAESHHRQTAAACGTRGGYQKHRRNGEAACDPCRAANSAADRRLRTTGTTVAA